MRSGRFIVLEGGEGSGKSTQAGLLAERLDALLTREPGGTPLGEAIRHLVLDPGLGPITARAELLLMAAARAEHVATVIAPALAQGRDVVCDRFEGSTLAYQGYGRETPLEEVATACRLASPDRRPDLTVLLEVPPEVAASRRGGRPDRIEAAGPQFHARVAEGFRAQAAASPQRWAVVDGSGSVEAVARAVAAVVEQRLPISSPVGRA